MKKEVRKITKYGDHLLDRRIVFVIKPNIYAYKAIEAIAELRRYGCDVFASITKEGLKYVSKLDLVWATGNKVNDNQLYGEIVDFEGSSESEIVEVSKIVRSLSKSNLRGVKILVTAGPTPVKIDNVRRMTNKFSGKLGIEIANELYLRGADVTLYQSYSGIRPPKYLNQILFQDYEEYRQLCLSNCNNFEYGIFSAAVSDYKPKEVVDGKIPSGGVLKSIELVQTDKVINLVREANPNLKMISFKYEEGKTLEELLAIATKRLRSGHIRVVANDLTLNKELQKCFLCKMDSNKNAFVLSTAEGKKNIARMIADDLEEINK